jgi:hypothetical protein
VRGHFADLVGVPLGALITVVFDDGTQHDFAVTNVELALKPEVVTNGVFGSSGEPVLRLVTCGGEYERELRSYRSNVIVTAVSGCDSSPQRELTRTSHQGESGRGPEGARVLRADGPGECAAGGVVEVDGGDGDVLDPL